MLTTIKRIFVFLIVFFTLIIALALNVHSELEAQQVTELEISYTHLPKNRVVRPFSAEEVIVLTNQERARFDLPPLTENRKLARSAELKGEDMLVKDYFAHDGPDGSTPWDWFYEAGYDYSYAGENLALWYSDAAEVVQGWMDSPKHRENILNSDYKEIGIGIVTDYPERRTMVVQHFGAL